MFKQGKRLLFVDSLNDELWKGKGSKFKDVVGKFSQILLHFEINNIHTARPTVFLDLGFIQFLSKVIQTEIIYLIYNINT